MKPDPPGPAGGSGSREPGTAADGGRRLGLLDLLRGLFLVAAVGFGWWSLRAYHSDIVAALSQVSPVRILAALVVVSLGLGVTGAIWRVLLRGFGHSVPARSAASIFFVGQLGKYIPGSVWSLGAQAEMARRFHVPPRTTVATGLVFLWVHVVSALPVAVLPGSWRVAAQTGQEPILRSGPLADWVTWISSPAWPATAAACLAAVLLVSPVVLGLVGRLFAGGSRQLRVTWAQSVALLAGMAVTWFLYGVGLALVVPTPTLQSSGGLVAVLPWVTAAFAAAYLVGVVIVLAPAGAGARELTLIALLAPLLGVPAATATTLLVRVVHTVDDFAVAGIAWLVGRPGHTEAPLAPGAPDGQRTRDSGA